MAILQLVAASDGGDFDIVHLGFPVKWSSGRVVLHPYASDITGGRCVHGSIVLTSFTIVLLCVFYSFCLVAWVTEVVDDPCSE